MVRPKAKMAPVRVSLEDRPSLGIKTPNTMSRAELEEEVSYWRGASRVAHDGADVRRVASAGVRGRMPAIMALSLFHAAPGTLSKWFLLNHLHANGSRADCRKVIDVYLHYIREAFGFDVIDNPYPGVLQMTPQGVEAIEALGVARLTQVAA